MRTTLLLVAMTMAVVASAQVQETADSLKMEQLNEVVVSGVRTQKNAPYAVTNIKRAELAAFSTTGQELPFLFARTPGVLAWSENGVGTGTTYMRIRGAGDSRINVTLDGVPLNSPEDQCFLPFLYKRVKKARKRVNNKVVIEALLGQMRKKK